ncbi:MAG: Htur_1727 family rSAM-partnered candidate RiPP [Haloglomus sp.]
MTDEADAAGAGGVRASADTDRRRMTAPRADDQPEWELFLRESPTEPLCHAGSVTAESAEAAHERASELFPEATTLWCCPASRVARFTERDLGSEYRGGTADGPDDEPADGSGGKGDDGPDGEATDAAADAASAGGEHS